MMFLQDPSFELMEMFKVEIVELIKTLKKTNYLPLISFLPRIDKNTPLFFSGLDVENDNLLDIIKDFMFNEIRTRLKEKFNLNF